MAADQFIYNLTDTWNQAGTSYAAIKMNVADAASAADSKLIDLQINSVSKFNVDKDGNLATTGAITASLGTTLRAGFNIPQRSDDPTAIANGDIWTKATGLFYRIAGLVRQAWDTGSMPEATDAEADAANVTLPRAWSPARIARLAKRKDNTARARNRMTDPALLVSQQNYNTSSSVSGWYASDVWHKALIGTGLNNGFGRVFSNTPGGSPFRLRFVNGLVKASLAAGDIDVIIAEVEDVEVPDYRFGTPDAMRLTFRFGCRMPAGTWALKIGGSAATSRSYLTSFVVTASEANTDIVKTFEIPGDVTGSWPVMNNQLALTICFGLAVGSSFVGTAGWQNGNFLAPPGCTNFAALPVGTAAEFFDFQLFVGLDAGEEPPPFVVPSYEETLRKCQRYYETGQTHMVFDAQSSASQTSDVVRYKVTKRANPAVSLTANRNANVQGTGSDTYAFDSFRIFARAAGPGAAEWSGVWTANARM